MILTVAQLRLCFDGPRLNELSSRYDDSVGSIVYDETIISTCIAQADSLIKGNLVKGYTVAQIEADASLQRLCANITLYFLELGKGSLPDTVKTNYLEALERLARIRSGDEILAAVTQQLPTATNITPLTEEVSEDEYFSDLISDSEVL